MKKPTNKDYLSLKYVKKYIQEKEDKSYNKALEDVFRIKIDCGDSMASKYRKQGAELLLEKIKELKKGAKEK